MGQSPRLARDLFGLWLLCCLRCSGVLLSPRRSGRGVRKLALWRTHRHEPRTPSKRLHLRRGLWCERTVLGLVLGVLLDLVSRWARGPCLFGRCLALALSLLLAPGKNLRPDSATHPEIIHSQGFVVVLNFSQHVETLAGQRQVPDGVVWEQDPVGEWEVGIDTRNGDVGCLTPIRSRVLRRAPHSRYIAPTAYLKHQHPKAPTSVCPAPGRLGHGFAPSAPTCSLGRVIHPPHVVKHQDRGTCGPTTLETSRPIGAREARRYLVTNVRQASQRAAPPAERLPYVASSTLACAGNLSSRLFGFGAALDLRLVVRLHHRNAVVCVLQLVLLSCSILSALSRPLECTGKTLLKSQSGRRRTEASDGHGLRPAHGPPNYVRHILHTLREGMASSGSRRGI
mmetsp:Transcript_25962/g.68079  ORF Transcript_25962/g.68079 Transcript_25962/m.68079 type:complete len:397 (-) Transcript_25962:653-1843(-)